MILSVLILPLGKEQHSMAPLTNKMETFTKRVPRGLEETDDVVLNTVLVKERTCHKEEGFKLTSSAAGSEPDSVRPPDSASLLSCFAAIHQFLLP